MLSIQDGELLTEGEVIECQFILQPAGGQDHEEQLQNRKHHGRVASGPEARKVNRFNEVGVLAKVKVPRCGVRGRRESEPDCFLERGFGGVTGISLLQQAPDATC